MLRCKVFFPLPFKARHFVLNYPPFNILKKLFVIQQISCEKQFLVKTNVGQLLGSKSFSSSKFQGTNFG
jgi:hypothetical protein